MGSDNFVPTDRQYAEFLMNLYVGNSVELWVESLNYVNFRDPALHCGQ